MSFVLRPAFLVAFTLRRKDKPKYSESSWQTGIWWKKADQSCIRTVGALFIRRVSSLKRFNKSGRYGRLTAGGCLLTPESFFPFQIALACVSDLGTEKYVPNHFTACTLHCNNIPILINSTATSKPSRGHHDNTSPGPTTSLSFRRPTRSPGVSVGDEVIHGEKDVPVQENALTLGIVDPVLVQNTVGMIYMLLGENRGEPLGGTTPLDDLLRLPDALLLNSSWKSPNGERGQASGFILRSPSTCRLSTLFRTRSSYVRHWYSL